MVLFLPWPLCILRTHGDFSYGSRRGCFELRLLGSISAQMLLLPLLFCILGAGGVDVNLASWDKTRLRCCFFLGFCAFLPSETSPTGAGGDDVNLVSLGKTRLRFCFSLGSNSFSGSRETSPMGTCGDGGNLVSWGKKRRWFIPLGGANGSEAIVT